MTEKQSTIKDFMDMLYRDNTNSKSIRNDHSDIFGKDAPFSIVCNKCGSTQIEIIGEGGINYGGQTGYQHGYTVIKCNQCGNAETIYES